MSHTRIPLYTPRFAHTRTRSVYAFTLFELIVVLMLAGILGSIAVSNLSALANPAQSASAELAGFLKEVRARAIAQTVAYKVTATNSRTIVTKFANTCSTANPTDDPTLTLSLPSQSHLTSTNWEICFTSRGLSTTNTVLTLQDQFNTTNVEVLLGGGVRLS